MARKKLTDTELERNIHGTQEEGLYEVFVPNSREDGISWGPFMTRTVAKDFLKKVNDPRKYAVNRREFPKWFN